MFKQSNISLTLTHVFMQLKELRIKREFVHVWSNFFDYAFGVFMRMESTNIEENLYQKPFPIPNIMHMGGLCCRIACICLYYYHEIRFNS